MSAKLLKAGMLWLALTAGYAVAAQPPGTDVLTEHSAAMWGAGAQWASAQVYDHPGFSKVGAYSIRFETDGGFDTWLWAPVGKNGNWDLVAAGCGGVAFWVYAQNYNLGFQSLSPWVRLHTSEYHYFDYRPNYDLLNDARNQWLYVTVPLNGDDVWSCTVVGDPDLAHINYIEIHADTWDAGFKLWFDGLTFDVPLNPPRGLLAVAGNHQVSLCWRPFVDLFGQFDHYAIYRSTADFSNVTGMTPIATLSGINNTQYVDTTAQNGTGYYYAVTAVLTNGTETTQVDAVGPRKPRDETDLQVTYISRTPRYPRYWPNYTYYEVVEPSGFGPYIFSAATGLLGGQNANTQRWPNVGDPVTYTAYVRNRGTNVWSGTLGGVWRVDGSVAGSPSQPVALAPGDVTSFAFVLNWDGQWHEIQFTLNVSDARPENNQRAIHTKSAPFLTYVDLGFVERFRDEYSPNWPLAATDDVLDWLQRHAARMNEMFAEKGSPKRVHYDLLEVIHDYDADPNINTIYFGVFPFRYYSYNGDPRLPGYYHADVDIDYGLCHEMSHQLGLIDIYRLDLPGERNEVSGLTYWGPDCLMRTCAPFYSDHSAGGMAHWENIVHGYYGQYLYCLPGEVRLRILDYKGDPLRGAAITMYQKCERPGLGELITTQVKAQGVTDENGEWTLPNVPINPNMVPPTYAGDVLHDNPFGYVAVVGTNGLLHFKIEYEDYREYAWLDITEVNNAYWAGQTDVAVFERQMPFGGEVQQYPPLDMTELNAANWYGWAQEGTLTLSDDLSEKYVGQSALKIVATGGLDNFVRYPYGLLGRWDLSEVEFIRFWAYAQNPNGSFENYSPRLRLGHYQDGYFEWRPWGNMLNAAMYGWREFIVPIEGSATWTRTVNGDPDLDLINYLEIHADTAGAGFTLWLDGVTFEPHPYLEIGDVNCDGTIDGFDIQPFVLALTNPGEYANQYPDCDLRHADCDGNGVVDGFDIQPFVELLTGK